MKTTSTSYELEYTLQRAKKDRDLKQIRKITDLADICYVRQKNQKGIGDAIKCSQRHVEDEPFAVLLGHTITKGTVPCTKQLINAYEKYKSPIVSLMEVPKDNLHLHRIIKGNKVENGIYKIDEILERPQKSSSNLAMMGRYILTPDIFDKINKTEAGFGGEIHLTDALSKLDSLYGAIFKGKSYYIGNRLEWLKTTIEYALDDEEFKDDLVRYMKTYI